MPEVEDRVHGVSVYDVYVQMATIVKTTTMLILWKIIVSHDIADKPRPLVPWSPSIIIIFQSIIWKSVMVISVIMIWIIKIIELCRISWWNSRGGGCVISEYKKVIFLDYCIITNLLYILTKVNEMKNVYTITWITPIFPDINIISAFLIT